MKLVRLFVLACGVVALSLFLVPLVALRMSAEVLSWLLSAVGRLVALFLLGVVVLAWASLLWPTMVPILLR